MPLFGGLDDVLVVVLAVDAFLAGLPPELIDEKLDELGIPRASWKRTCAACGADRAELRASDRRAHPGRDRRAASDSSTGVDIRRPRAPADTWRANLGEGHSDRRRRQARQERRAEGSRRRLRAQLPVRRKLAVPAAGGASAPGSTTLPAAKTSASASAKRPRSLPSASRRRR